MSRNISIVLLLLLGCSLHRVYTQDSTTTESSTSESTSTESSTTVSSESTGSTGSTTTKAPVFSCPTHAGTVIDLKAISGNWYETARAPSGDTNHCLRYAFPDSPNSDNSVVIETEFINGANNLWEPTKESITLPWDDNAKNGIFVWDIGGVSKLSLNMKLVDTDFKTYSLYCFYIANMPVTGFKILTRKRELSDADKTTVQQKFGEIIPSTQLEWVEQSEQKCNSAMRSAGGILVALVLVLLVRQRNF